MSYADLAAFKAYARINDTLDDVEIQRALDAASSVIEHLCSQSFDLADGAVSHWYLPYWSAADGRWRLPIDPVVDTTGLVAYGYDTSSEDWDSPLTPLVLRPINAGVDGAPVTELILPSTYTPAARYGMPPADSDADYVKVTALFGYTTVPAAVVEATLIQAARIFKRRDTPFGIASSPDGSENTRLLNTVDPDVYRVLKAYIRYWAAK